MFKRNKPKCPNCQGFSSVFYCSECIQKGNFIHSSMKYPIRFADVSLSESTLRSRVSKAGASALTNPCPILKRDILKRNIELLKEKNILIKKVIEDEKNKKKCAEMEIEIVKTQIFDIRSRTRRLKIVNDGLQENVYRYKSVIPEKKEFIANLERERRIHVRNVVKELVTIFPLCEIVPESSEDDYETPSIRERVQCIDEATHTHYVNGRWVTIPNFLYQRNFSLLTSVLPTSGDYAAFARQQSLLDFEDGNIKKAGSNILAGLSFFCQLVNSLADLVNVPLPKSASLKQLLSLGGEEIEGKKVQKLVARLNSSVIFLCASQGLSSSSIHPLKPLLSVNALLTDPNVDLGRLKSFEIPQELVDILEEIDELEDFDSDTDSEWETINASAIPEIPAMAPPRRKISFDETASNIVTSAATSVLSIFGLGKN